MPRPTNELVQIAAAGGGLRLSLRSRPTHEIVQIAAATSNKGAALYLTDAGSRPTNELVQIAAAGKGSVVFEF